MSISLPRFRPALIDSLKGYNRERFTRDVAAGLTVGVVALPLAMAFAIASGLKPEAGIFTAVIAGLLISVFGGSPVQIGGPAGAFIVIVYGILERYGLANLIIATAMSGLLLFLMGVLRLGTLVRFIPIAVVIGFTNGIAVLIALSQVKDVLGLKVAKMPADFFGMLHTLADALPTFNATALALAAASLAVIIIWQFFMPKIGSGIQFAGKLTPIPGSIVALVLATTATSFFGLDVETIGSRFGGIPSGLPAFTLPDFSWETARHLFMPTFTLAMLGAIESLLCARVADSMTDSRHDPNQELMGQGIANFVTPFFGGMPATGTIARTVTNIKSGASSPIAGIVHSLTLLVVLLVAAPLASKIPLATLAAILLFVAWNMGEWREFVHLRNYRLPYRVTLLAVFFLTVVFDLTVAVEIGLVASLLTFIYRISSLSRAEPVTADAFPELRGHEAEIQAWRLYGALFFGAVELLERIERELPQQALILDLKNLIYMDTSGADALQSLIKTSHKRGVRFILCGMSHQPLEMAQRSGLLALVGPDAIYPSLAEAIRAAVPRQAQA
ncbi:SulP family sulfate permease [Tibeticola sediminis]|uniref:SulP family sulfate permease n=1 Tax=Tibeticola sediminis TaxID=1917811 RepID=A0A3N4UQM2_9BURK|nr:SulP family inorganic anion transporter [Tibeticola sediminis]RPE72976.1 SulP family sulfate permease [Tibeticola sediminis]